MQLLPNLTRVGLAHQNIYFYYEVYDPALADAGARPAHEPRVLSRRRQGVRNAARRATDDRRRAAARSACSSSRCPRVNFHPGTYTCQVNIIDAVAGRVAFPRLQFQVR